jgi:hypothetical protein
MSVETQLRDYATRIEATPISIEEITSPRRVVAPTTWHRPVLAAALCSWSQGSVRSWCNLKPR